jgi:hypothetical protein
MKNMMRLYTNSIFELFNLFEVGLGYEHFSEVKEPLYHHVGWVENEYDSDPNSHNYFLLNSDISIYFKQKQCIRCNIVTC